MTAGARSIFGGARGAFGDARASFAAARGDFGGARGRGIVTVPQDGPDDWYVPATVADFAALGLEQPAAIWGFQESSGAIVDLSPTGLDLAATGTVGYGAAVAGWSRVGATVAMGAGNRFGRAVAESPVVDAEPTLWLAYVDFTGGAGVARCAIIGTDSAGPTEASVGHSAGNVTQAKSGSTSVNGADNPITGTARLVGLQVDINAGVLRGFTDAEILAPAYTIPVDGNKGFGAGVRPAAAMTILWGALWEATAAELDVNELRALCNALNVNVAW